MEGTQSYLAYKILFEAMVRFSAGISKVKSLENLPGEISRHLKYLINFQDFRFYYVVPEGMDGIVVDKGGYTSYDFGCHLDPNSLEAEVMETAIPTQVTCSETGHQIHCWKFTSGKDQDSLIRIRSQDTVSLAENSIPIIKVINKMVAARVENLKMIDLIHRQNQKLETLTVALQSKNEEIRELNRLQEATIEVKTARLKSSNSKLKALIQFNSHQLREPLTRVLGMIAIKNDIPQGEFISDILPLMQESVLDLDLAVREVIERSELLKEEIETT